VRVLVADSPALSASRMRTAAEGLALRGHQVIRKLEPDGGRNPQLVLGAGPPAGAVVRGWRAAAHVVVQQITPAELRRWSLVDRWLWASLYAFALVEERDAGEIRLHPGPLLLDRVGLWSSEAPAERPAAEHADVEILERAGERSIARHRSAAPRRAVFLDRDGTLVEEVGYLDDPERLRLLPGVAGALRSLHAAGFALVVISNQSGVGRGLYTMATAYAVMARLRSELRREGVELDAIYFCPHRPDQGCACRKPGIELVERAAEDLLLDPRHSVMIGDKQIDIETARRAGAAGLLVQSGYGEEEARRIEQAGAPRPDHVASDFAAAARWAIDRLA